MLFLTSSCIQQKLYDPRTRKPAVLARQCLPRYEASVAKRNAYARAIFQGACSVRGFPLLLQSPNTVTAFFNRHPGAGPGFTGARVQWKNTVHQRSEPNLVFILARLVLHLQQYPATTGTTPLYTYYDEYGAARYI